MITINGCAAPDAKNMTVSAYLEKEGYNPVRIAIELNEVILNKNKYDTTRLKDGDIMEIVHFMGGGQSNAAKAAEWRLL